jgi:preprotein translocase subunit SecB
MTDSVVAQNSDQPLFSIQRVFLKGLSLEMPQGPRTFLEQNAPVMNLNMQVESEELEPGVFEVHIRATLTAEASGKVLFLVEADQSGIFEVRNFPASQVVDILEIGAPSILAPYLRAQLSDTLVRASLPTFYMPEINWAAMAQQRRTQTASDPMRLN